MLVSSVSAKKAYVAGSAMVSQTSCCVQCTCESRRVGADQADFSKAEALEAFAEAQSDPVAEREQEGRSLLGIIRENQERLRQSAEQFEKMQPKPKPVPSGLGLSTKAAMAKFSAAELSVATIVQEYSDQVPAGHVISHMPGPGARITQQAGIRLFVSKGPPPNQRSKYNREFLPQSRTGENSGSAKESGGGTTSVRQAVPESSPPMVSPEGTCIITNH